MASMRRRQAHPETTRGGPGVPRFEEPAGTPAAAPGGAPPAVPSTRTGRAWVSLGAGIAVLVVILVFILQNLQSVKVSFFAAHWKIPLALDLLLAAILGGGVVLTAGSIRILQLRRLARQRQREALRSGR